MIAEPWSNKRCTLVMLSLVVVLIAGISVVALIWQGLMEKYQGVAEDSIYRTEHYQRIAQREEKLKQALKSPKLKQFIERNYLTGEATGVAYADLQQQVKEVIETAGGTVLSTQLVQDGQQQPESGPEKILVRV
ncbi:MAG: type II secretion system protein GspM, partial [Candidatus Thiodiazotropha sp.]